MTDARLVVQIDGQDNLSDELKKIESGVIRFVGAVSSALTAISAFAFPVIGAAQFQKELLNAAKTTNFTTEQLNTLKAGLEGVSKQVNVTAVDLAKIATMGGQIGIGQGNPAALIEFTKTIATAVSALDLDAELVVASVGKLINIFDIKPTQFRNTVSALNEVSNVSNATAEQLFDVVRRIGNLGGSVDLPEAAALSATLIDLGLTAETAGTTITKIFADFKSNASEFATVVRGQGIGSTKEWIDLVENDGLSALTAYIDALNSLDVENASALKGRLTGEGRLFEAVTKLQEQRKRELRFVDQAEEVEARILKMRKESVDVNEQELAGLKQQATALRDASVQANALARLTKAATDAYKLGNSAEKEQRTVLGGLSAQWTVFLNNVKALAIAAGDTLLPPLTQALRALSTELGQAVNADSLRRAGDDIIAAVRAILSAFEMVRDAAAVLGSSGLDWGAILRLAALATSFALLKGFISLMRALGTNAIAAVPALNALGSALFGSVAASGKAGDGLKKSGEAAERTGGLFQKAATSIRTSVNRIATESQKLATAQTLVSRLVASTTDKRDAARDRADAVLRQKRLSQLQSEQAIQQRIASQQQALAAAQAAGQTGRSRSLKGDITFLTNQLSALRSATLATQQYETRLDALNKKQAQINQGVSRTTLSGQFDNLVKSAQNAGTRMASGIATNFNNGVRTGFGTQVRSSFGGLFNTVSSIASDAGRGASRAFTSALSAFQGSGGTALRGVTQAFGSVGQAATKAGDAIKGTAASVRSLGASGVAAGALGTVTALASALARLSTRGMGAAGAGITGIFASIAAWAGRASLSLAGYTAAWAAASTATARGAVIAATGFRLLTGAIGLVFKGLMGLFNVAFFALFFADILKAIGLWDKLAEKIEEVANYFGFEVPNFLKSEKSLRAQAEAVAAIEAEYEAAYRSASRFDAVMKGVALTAQNTKLAAEDLTFTVSDPEKAQRNFESYLDALVTGYSKAQQVAGNILALEKEISSTRARQKSSLSGVSAVDIAKSSSVTDAQILAETESGVEALTKRLRELKDEQASLGDQSLGLENVATSFFSAGEAAALFTKNTETGLSVLEQYTNNLLEINRVSKEREALENRLAGYKGAGAPRTATQAAIEAQRNLALADQLDARLKTLATSNEKLEDEMANVQLGGGRLGAVLERLRNEADTKTISEFSAALQQVGSNLEAFRGLSVPNIQANDIFTAAAAVEVNRRTKAMYDQWVAAANTAAERAGNYAAQAQGEIQKLLRDTEAYIDRLTQTAAQKKRQAASQVQDRTDDAASRQTLRNIQTRYDVERALLEQQIGRQQRVFAEQENGGRRVFGQKQQAYAFEQQALFELEERFGRLRQAEEDRLNLQKQRRGVKEELAEFDQLLKKVDRYKVKVEEANKKLADPNLTGVQRAGAVEARIVALDKLRSTYSLLESAGDRLASKDPIGGQLVVSASELDRVKKAVDATAETIGKVTLQNAGDIKGAYSAVASELSTAATAYSRQLDAATGRFEQLSRDQNISKDAVAEILAQTARLPSLIQQIQGQTQNGLLNLGTIDTEKFREQAAQAIAQLGADAKNLFAETEGFVGPIQLTVDEFALKTSIRRGYEEAKQEAKAAPLALEASIAKGSLTSMQNQIQDTVKPKIDAELNVNKISGNLGPLSVSWGGNKARGGLMGDVLSMGTGIARFASGGRVRGPGGGTDDRIFAALSNGEYVMDALTTSRFGPKFFSTLQAMARGGLSTNFLNRFSLPKFASGGPVGLDMFSGVSGIANDFKSSGSTAAVPMREVVDINLSDGNRRATIQAEREQAKTLVSILSSFQKGK